MENSKSFTNSILQSSEMPSSNFLTDNTSNFSNVENSNSIFDYLKSINITTWILIVLILAFLGFNIFVYLAQGTQDITNFFKPILEKIFGTAINTTGNVIDVSAEGAKAIVNTSANVLDKGLSGIQSITPNSSPTSLNNQSINSTFPQVNSVENTSLNRALNSSKQSQQIDNNDYQAHEAPSSVHTTNKSGWCFVGEDRGFRTCAAIGVNDQCMSGDIFPSQEICINPNLRV